MIGITMCSGIGAPEVAAPWVDWRLASEIEPFPREVLKVRLGYKDPSDHNQGDPLLWGDMTEVNPNLLRRHGIPSPDLLVAGTPCQAFSVAGLRRGLDDERGNLTLELVRIVHEFVAARPDGKFTLVWENVPGVLSDKGNAFGCFLGGLVGAMDALPSPDGGSWSGEGMVEGPRARAAWSVLDAQWFGVAQRRRRVFVVCDFGGAIDPAAVLLEPDSMRGDTPPSRKAGEAVAPTISARPTGGGGLGTDFDLDGGLVTTLGDVTHALRAEGFDASEDGTGRGTPIVAARMTAIGEYICDDTASTIKQRDHKDATDLIAAPIAFDCKGTEVQTVTDGSHPTLRSMGHNNSHQNAGGHAAVAIQERATAANPNAGPQGKGFQEDLAFTLEARPVDVAQPLMAGGHVGGNQGGDYIQQAAAFAQNQRGELRESDVSPQLTCGGGKPGQGYPAVRTPWALRRLTPVECHRLQGFPDNHCLIPVARARKIAADEYDRLREYSRADWVDFFGVDLGGLEIPSDEQIRTLAADGPQYKALGNSMAVSVMKWILDRVRISHDQMKQRTTTHD